MNTRVNRFPPPRHGEEAPTEASEMEIIRRFTVARSAVWNRGVPVASAFCEKNVRLGKTLKDFARRMRVRCPPPHSNPAVIRVPSLFSFFNFLLWGRHVRQLNWFCCVFSVCQMMNDSYYIHMFMRMFFNWKWLANIFHY